MDVFVSPSPGGEPSCSDEVLGEKLTSTPQDSPHFSERVRRTLVSGLFMQVAMVDDSGKVTSLQLFYKSVTALCK